MDHEACETELRVSEMPTCSFSPGRMTVPSRVVDKRYKRQNGETRDSNWHLGGSKYVGISKNMTDGSITSA
jgi:hypothetical protein